MPAISESPDETESTERPPETLWLAPEGAAAWEELQNRPARHLDSVAELMERTAPWQEQHSLVPEDATGVWLVTTRSAQHLFDLDARMYKRTPNGGQSFAHDGRWCRITRVQAWPRVGGKFFIWFDDPDAPDLLEHWRQSSTISAISTLPAGEAAGGHTGA